MMLSISADLCIHRQDEYATPPPRSGYYGVKLADYLHEVHGSYVVGWDVEFLTDWSTGSYTVDAIQVAQVKYWSVSPLSRLTRSPKYLLTDGIDYLTYMND